jgi:hypothetical protein
VYILYFSMIHIVQYISLIYHSTVFNLSNSVSHS